MHTVHKTRLTLHCTLYIRTVYIYILHATLGTTLHSTVHTLHPKPHTVHSTLPTPGLTHHTLHPTFQTPPFQNLNQPNTPHSTLRSRHFRLRTLHSLVRTLHFKLYTAHPFQPSTFYSIHLLLHRLHFHSPPHMPQLTHKTSHSLLYNWNSTPSFLLSAHFHIFYFPMTSPQSPIHTLHSTVSTQNFTLHALHSTQSIPRSVRANFMLTLQTLALCTLLPTLLEKMFHHSVLHEYIWIRGFECGDGQL